MNYLPSATSSKIQGGIQGPLIAALRPSRVAPSAQHVTLRIAFAMSGRDMFTNHMKAPSAVPLSAAAIPYMVHQCTVQEAGSSTQRSMDTSVIRL